MADYSLGTAQGTIEIEYDGAGIAKAKQDISTAFTSLEKSIGPVGSALDNVSGRTGKFTSGLSNAFGTVSGQASSFSSSLDGVISRLNASASGGLVKSIDDVGQKMKSVGSSMTKNVTMPVVGAATAAAGLIGTLGFKRLVGIDTARGQFQGLGYDADAVMKQVDAGVTGTSLSMAEGAQAAVGILATGAVPMEGLEASIQRVANVSAAYGVEANQAGNLLNKVLTKNKVEWGDLSQMQENGIPVTKALADSMGVAQSEIQKMATDGKISVEQLNTALDESAGSAAEAYAGTWAGITANIKSNLGKIGAMAMEPTFEIVKDKAADFLDLLKSPEFASAATTIGEQIASFVSSAIDAISSLISWWTNLSTEQQKLIGTIVAIVVAAGPILTIVGTIISSITRLVSIVTTIIKVVKLVTTVVRILFALMAANPIGAILVVIGLLVSALVYFFTETERGKEIWASFTEFLSNAVEVIKEKFSQFVEWFTTTVPEKFNEFKEFMVQLWEAIKTVFTEMWQGFVTTVVTKIAEIGASIVSGWETVKSAFSSAWESIKTVFSNAWEAIKSTASNAVNSVRDTLSNVWSSISSTVSSVWESIKSSISNAWDSIKSTVSNAMSAVLDAIRNGFNNAVQTASEFPGRVKSALGNLASILVDSGRALIQGFIDGILAMVGRVKNAASSVVSAARDLFPFSPAKEGPLSGRGWVLYSGHAVSQAFAKGMEDKIGDVKDAAETVTETVVEKFVLADFMRTEGERAAKGFAEGLLSQKESIVIASKEIAGAFTGEDYGLGELVHILGEPTAWDVVNITEELAQAFKGGDWGYGTLADRFGITLGRQLVDIAARAGNHARRLGVTNEMADAFVDGLPEMIGQGIEAVNDFITGDGLKTLIANAPRLFESAGRLLDLSLVRGIISGESTVVDAVGGIFHKVADFIDANPELVKAMQEAAGKAVQAFADQLVRDRGKITDAFSEISKGLSGADFDTSAIEGVFGKGVTSAITSQLPAVTAGLTGAVTAAMPAITAAAGALGIAVPGIGTIVAGLIAGLPFAVNFLIDAFKWVADSGIIPKIIGSLSDGLRMVGDSVKTLFNGILSGFRGGLISGIKGLVTSTAGFIGNIFKGIWDVATGNFGGDTKKETGREGGSDSGRPRVIYIPAPQTNDGQFRDLVINTTKDTAPEIVDEALFQVKRNSRQYKGAY